MVDNQPGEVSLIKLDAFQQALVEAKTIPEVKNLTDQADLFRQWLKKQGVGRQAQNAGAQMCLMGQRRLGWMLSPEQIEREERKRTDLSGVHYALQTKYQQALGENNIEPSKSTRWQKLADIPEDTFREFIQTYQESLEEITTIALIRFYYTKIITPLTETIPFPEGKFAVIACDPPWQYGNPYNPDSRRGCCRYPEMSFEQLAGLKIPAADNCLFWLWTTNAFMHDAYHLLEIWEFEPKTILTWFKEKIGVGYWLRGETEHCLLAVRGQPKINHIAQSTHLKVKSHNHSTKPDEFYQLVESLCGEASEETHLEMFAREVRTRWKVWGNEII